MQLLPCIANRCKNIKKNRMRNSGKNNIKSIYCIAGKFVPKRFGKGKFGEWHCELIIIIM